MKNLIEVTVADGCKAIIPLKNIDYIEELKCYKNSKSFVSFGRNSFNVRESLEELKAKLNAADFIEIDVEGNFLEDVYKALLPIENINYVGEDPENGTTLISLKAGKDFTVKNTFEYIKSQLAKAVQQ